VAVAALGALAQCSPPLWCDHLSPQALPLVLAAAAQQEELQAGCPAKPQQRQGHMRAVGQGPPAAWLSAALLCWHSCGSARRLLQRQATPQPRTGQGRGEGLLQANSSSRTRLLAAVCSPSQHHCHHQLQQLQQLVCRPME
jgi:sterol desaturase/sphingolipid hydroxylase (fatty acid hydroxylase superfamily)